MKKNTNVVNCFFYDEMQAKELKIFLEEKVIAYNTLEYIETDPIQIPHRFKNKKDIEIAAFLTATIAWGKRAMIIKNASKMMKILENAPFDFVWNATENDLKKIQKLGGVHRTFNSEDLVFFIKSLQNIYRNYGGLEQIFIKNQTQDSMQIAIHKLKTIFFELPHKKRTQKHIADPLKGSAAKRINMFLRWLVRSDAMGVDFGIWNNIAPSKLSCPLDVHSGNISRELGILKRKQNDAKALKELDNYLRKLDPKDPAKYDYALFGLGVFEGF